MTKYKLIYVHPARLQKVQVVIEEADSMRAVSISRILYKLTSDWKLHEMSEIDNSAESGFTRIA